MTEINKNDIKKSLVALGIKTGETVIVHSSMKSMGYVIGGPDAVIDAFLEILGQSGTLVMPTLSRKNFLDAYKDWHIDRPSDVGLLTEVFRKREGALRSNQATHSVAAFGKDAEFITGEHTAFGPLLTPFGEYAFCKSSPWQKLYDRNAKIVFLGVSTQFNTMKHLAEAKFVEWELSKIKGTKHYDSFEKRIKHFGNTSPEVVWPYVPWAPLEEEYEQAGMLKKATCGDAKVLCLEAARCVDFMQMTMKANPEKHLNKLSFEWYIEIEQIVKDLETTIK